MGVHQYKIDLIPRAYFGRHVPATISDLDVERGQDFASGWWSCHPPIAPLIAGLRTLLPTDARWGETEQFVSSGDWGSDVRIWRKDGRAYSITFRFAPVNGWPLMQQFLRIARDGDRLLLERESGAILEPDEEVVRGRLARSRAMQFVRDPEAAIIEAARKLRDNAG